MQGADRLTAFVKATFALRHQTMAELSAPLEIVRADRQREGWGSLEEASETAPYLPSAGVLLRGHASTPAGQTATSLRVRLAISQQGRWILNKTLHVFGDRSRGDQNPRPFQRIPLVYERAYGGPHIELNPVGAGSGDVLPNIVDPVNPARPAGFGPIAKQWAPRRHLGARIPAPASASAMEELDPHFDFRSFHAAPIDQQIEFLRGNEWLFLEGFHPHFPWLTSSLPSARGAARLYRTRPGERDLAQPVDLVADTLVIDADRLICSVIWRGSVALSPGDAAPRMYLLAGVELPGRPIPWPEVNAPRLAAVNAALAAFLQDQALEADTEQMRPGAGANRPIAPFAIPPPRKAPSPGANAIPGAPWSPEPAIPPMAPSQSADPETTAMINPALLRRGGATSKHATASMPAYEDAPPPSDGLPFAPASAPPRLSEPPSAPVPFGLPFMSPESSSPRSDRLAPPSVPKPPAEISSGPISPPGYVPATPSAVAPPPMQPGYVPAAPSPVAPPPMQPAHVPAARSSVPPPPMQPGYVPTAPSPVAPPPLQPAKPETWLEPSKVLSNAESDRDVAAPNAEPPGRPEPVTSPAQPSIEPPARPPMVPAVEPTPEVLAPPAPTPPSSIPPEPSAQAPSPVPAPASASSPEPEAKDLRSKVLDRLKKRESLYDLDLAGAELEGVDWSFASLERRSLAGSNLARGNFTKVSLTGADLRGADLTGAIFDEADLSQANLSRATLAKARFGGATLTSADLSHTKGSGVSFEGASLKGANLRQARLLEAIFDGANLDGANANKADLSHSSFVKATLDAMNLRDGKLREATLAGASLDRADLRDADLTGSNVHGVNLAVAKTNGAILRDLVESPPPARGSEG